MYRLEFDVDKSPQRFAVLTNVEQFGFSLESIFAEWYKRSADYSLQNFCNFIRNKRSGVICFSEEEYQELYVA